MGLKKELVFSTVLVLGGGTLAVNAYNRLGETQPNLTNVQDAANRISPDVSEDDLRKAKQVMVGSSSRDRVLSALDVMEKHRAYLLEFDKLGGQSLTTTVKDEALAVVGGSGLCVIGIYLGAGSIIKGIRKSRSHLPRLSTF